MVSRLFNFILDSVLKRDRFILWLWNIVSVSHLLSISKSLSGLKFWKRFSFRWITRNRRYVRRIIVKSDSCYFIYIVLLLHPWSYSFLIVLILLFFLWNIVHCVNIWWLSLLPLTLIQNNHSSRLTVLSVPLTSSGFTVLPGQKGSNWSLFVALFIHWSYMRWNSTLTGR